MDNKPLILVENASPNVLNSIKESKDSVSNQTFENFINTPLVSIVLPAYNREQYITASIESILQQTYVNWELIIVDDCSTDNTLNIIQSFKDSRIKVLKNDINSGVSITLNKAISFASGDYIFRQDSDDISLPDRLKKQILFLETHRHIDICGAWMQVMNEEIILKYPEFCNQIEAAMLLSYPMASPSIVFRKNVFKKFRFQNDLRSGEDYQLLSEAITYFKAYNLQEVLVLYRKHDDQISTHHFNSQRMADIEIQLSILKKIDFDTQLYNDDFIKKMFFINEYFTVKEFSLYLKFLKEIIKLNKKQRVFDTVELKKVVNEIKNQLIFKIYFHSNFCEIDKNWRINALKKLPFSDLLFVLKLKIKERLKF